MDSKRPFLALLVALLSAPLNAQQDSFLLVSSRNTNSVRMYDAETGEYIRDWAPPGIGGLDRPQEVIYGPDGHVYVSGIGTPFVLKFDGRTGEYLGPFTNGYELDSPTKISWGPDGLMYVSQWGQNSGRRNVARFDPTTGAFIDEFTSDNPHATCDHLWDADGNMYLASFGEKRVIKYAPDGTRIGYFTPPAPAHGPVDLYWALNGDLMVVDWDNGRVNAHDPETGAFKRTFIEGMTNTEGITVGPDGRLYAADWTQNTINAYSALTGVGGTPFIDQSGGLKAPNALTFGPKEATTRTEGSRPERINLNVGPNFPNPFQRGTTIPFSADTGGRMLVQVFDLQGRLVTSERQMVLPGRQRFHFDASDLAPGRYTYTIDVDGSLGTGSMIKQ